ncbi:hypothetical protein A3D60_03070 [Candidatus Uhrbacteria bacterium RIFCSPHIGHO2_02_FULL_47_29]|nr:MAG: hypothetical protein A3D60_03070 [Candidatus Uhrbacteria bacterium RIFCSPHIGHO2_02_FULL_47_29]
MDPSFLAKKIPRIAGALGLRVVFWSKPLFVHTIRYATRMSDFASTAILLAKYVNFWRYPQLFYDLS